MKLHREICDQSKLLDIISLWSIKECKPKIAQADKENAAIAKKDAVCSRVTHARVLIEAAVPTKRSQFPRRWGNVGRLRSRSARLTHR
ncbi:hypothetical protein BV25DRAFT_1922884 [Artomyces pyxidatus]|uniref:Uncharacterized protein n=1 Tax=Artomyces pyxidatus TaxID=48021 RepID=A0ACB8SCR7_9AGAM|nr:hypothetical protein BV25DRAFT_1922884 [Artomyces pyxidatus]